MSQSDVRHYYEANTRLFIALGRERGARSIHRAVWGPGVTTLAAALGYVDGLIGAVASAMAARRGALRLADLGCGVGGSLLALVEGLCPPPLALGLTLSPAQARMARAYAEASGLEGRCAFVEADFLHAPLAPGLDLAYAIEAYAHAADPAAFFAEAAGLLAPGGQLLICDDFSAAPPRRHAERRLVAAFRWGWVLPRLASAEAAIAHAEASGLRLIERRDLSPLLHLRPLPAPLAAAALGLGRRLGGLHPFWRSLTGSIALQSCLRLGLVRYTWLHFERV
jgi:SAM-dependent methyltransferase